jgi:ribosomal protein L32
VVEGETPEPPTETPEPTTDPTEAPAPSPTEKPNGGEGREISWVNILAGLGAVAVLASIVFGVVRRQRRQAAAAAQEYCLSCGRPLAEGEVCPDCGPDAGRFKKPQL